MQKTLRRDVTHAIEFLARTELHQNTFKGPLSFACEPRFAESDSYIAGHAETTSLSKGRSRT